MIRLAEFLFVRSDMSKNINVNPGQYKVAGRERQGENIGQQHDRAVLAKNRDQQQTQRRANKKR
jgi:hypothetical protein